MPVLKPDGNVGLQSVTDTIDWIKSQLGRQDCAKLELVENGFVPENLDAEFYKKAFSSGNKFIREYFAGDLQLRNAKVEYLNRELNRPAGTDIMVVEIPASKVSERNYKELFTSDGDLLDREKAMDNFLWKLIDDINCFENFSLNVVLGIVAKLHIIGRWMALDAEQGRELLKTLISNVRGTYGNIEFETIK